MLRFFSRLHIGARIGVRLSGAFLLVALLGGIIGAFGVWGLARINDMNDQIAQIEFRGLSDIKEANISLIAAGRARKSFLAATSQEERQALRAEFDRDVENLERLRAKAAQTFIRESGKRLLAQFTEAEELWKREAIEFFNEAQTQPLAQVEDREESVLRAALVEGAAEFVAERMTGSVAYPLLHQWAKGREKELETIFLAEKDQKAIGSRWLYNQKGDDGWPGDLGYWVGYRVAKSYYDHAPDKAAAIKAIVDELGATSLKDMGKVMAAVKDRLGSQLDMSKASGWVKAALD